MRARIDSLAEINLRRVDEAMLKSQWLGFALALGLVALSGGNQACSGEKSAIMLAVNTDMKAPKDVNAVSVTVSTNNTVKHNVIGRVTPQGDILLPATLAVVEPNEENASIRIRVMAFQERKARVLRDVRTSIPSGGRVVLLRIPLNFVNDGSTQGQLPDNALPAPNPGTGGPGSSGSSGSSGSVDGGASADGGSGGSSGGGIAGGDTFDPFVFVPNCPNPEDTWIDGECKDAYIDPNTLPDFDDSLVGSGDVAAGNCFDVRKCFAEATQIGEGQGRSEPTVDAGTDQPNPVEGCGPDGKPCPSGQACIEGQCVPQFKSEPGQKDFKPRAITLDKNTCTVSLNGADAAKLNLAIVTPDTGECIQPGRCYIPLDKGAAFNVEGGQVKLPSYVCKLLTSKGLSLAASSTCASKEEKNPICLDKPGAVDDGGIGPVSSEAELVAAADFATSIGGIPGTLYYGSADGLAYVDLFKPRPFVSTPIAGSAKGQSPWRFSRVKSPRTVVDGLGKGFTISGGDSISGGAAAGGTRINGTVTFPPNNVAVDVAGFVWAVQGPNAGLYGSPPTGAATKINFITQGPPDATAVLSLGASSSAGFVVGELSGAVRACFIGTENRCGQPRVVADGRVDALALKPGTTNAGYALLPSGVYRSTVVDQFTGAIESALLVSAPTAGIDEGGKHYARGLAATAQCVFFASANGLEYVTDSGDAKGGGSLFAANGKKVLDVMIGATALDGSPASERIFFTVYGSKAEGGGVYSIALPQQCKGQSSVQVDAGFNDAGEGEGGACLPFGSDCLGPDQCCSMNCVEFKCQ